MLQIVLTKDQLELVKFNNDALLATSEIMNDSSQEFKKKYANLQFSIPRMKDKQEIVDKFLQDTRYTVNSTTDQQLIDIDIIK